MAIIPKYFNRVGGVSLWSYANGKVIYYEKINGIKEGLDFRFRFKFNTSTREGVSGDGEVGILGLNADSIRKWTSYEQYGANQRKDGGYMRFVTVYAGYENDGAKDASDREIFTMPVVGAYPTPPPEMWLNITGYTGCYCKDKVINNSLWVVFNKGSEEKVDPKKRFTMTVKQVCDGLAKAVGARLNWGGSLETEKTLPMLDGFDLTGNTAADAIRYINELHVGVRAYFASAVPGINGGLDQVIVMDDLRYSKHTPKKWEVHEISEETGMIGLPQFEVGPKVTVKCLLRRDIDVGSFISIKSKYVKSSHDFYVVNEVEYEGQFRGQPWYVTYTAITQEEQEKANTKKEAR